MMLLLLALFVTAAHGASISQHIVNGDVVNQGEFPSMLLLKKTGSSLTCAAVLIADNKALTAAHCVSDSSASFTVTCGSVNRADTPQIRSAQVVTHPDYDSDSSPVNYANDISILNLATAFNINDNCEPAALYNGDGQSGVVVGWGATAQGGAYSNVLRKGNVAITDCSDWGNGVGSKQVCAKDPNQNYGACNGDNGGGLFVNGELAGLLSWGPASCSPSIESVYTNVLAYQEWINS